MSEVPLYELFTLNPQTQTLIPKPQEGVWIQRIRALHEGFPKGLQLQGLATSPLSLSITYTVHFAGDFAQKSCRTVGQ